MTMSTRVVVSSDSDAFVLIGSDTPSEVVINRYLYDGDEAIGVITGVNGEVSVALDLLDRPPRSDDEDVFATVWECSLRVSAGKLRFVCPVYEEDDAVVAIPNGWWRLRMALRYEPYGIELDDDSLYKQQHLRIQCWLAERAESVLVKGCDYV